MNLKNQGPIFVPDQHRAEIEKLSKAALMDMVWDFAKQCTPADDDGNEAGDAEIMGTLRAVADVINTYRKQAKDAPK